METSAQDRVLEAADTLFGQTGKRPTLAEVRTYLGGGSMTTISEAMKIWRQKIDQRPVDTAIALPEKLEQETLKYMAALWHTATTMAGDRLAKEREELEQTRGEFDAQLAEADDVINALEREKQDALAQVNALTAKLEKVERQLRLEHDECLLAKSNNGQLEQALKEERLANQDMRKEYATTSKELTVAQTENKMLKEQIKELNKLLTAKLSGVKKS